MIDIEKVSKSYDGRLIIEDYSANIPEGQVTVLMGPSGSGKTTLANILLGLVKADKGRIEGMSGKRLSAVFQEDRLAPQLTAIGNIRLVLDKDYKNADILRHLSMVGLDEVVSRTPVSMLSGGEKRRVAIVRAIMASSDFICLDEPFTGIDEDTKEKVMDYVKDHLKGKTALLITHDPKEAKFFEGKLYVLPK